MIPLIDWQQNMLAFLQTLSDILTAAIAITSFSLFIYALTFKLRDRLTISFIFLLFCMVLVFGSDAFVAAVRDKSILEILLRIDWIGIILLPAIYFNFSDSLLTFTGKPSRGRRRILGIITYLVSIIFLCFLPTRLLVGEVVLNQSLSPYLQRNLMIEIFTSYFIIVMILAWYNMLRAVSRTVTHTSRRRMIYLVIGAIGPVVGSFPFLLFGSDFASSNLLLFWILAVVTNIIVGVLSIVMTYAVSFFGFPWPDRVIKSRLFRWIMRGPATASLTLGATTLVKRFGDLSGTDLSLVVILVMVGVIVLFEYMVTLFAPLWEKIFFSGSDREDLEIIRSVEDRMLTQKDLYQFLEMTLAAICDRVQAKGAFLTVLDTDTFETIITIGRTRIREKKFKKELFEFLSNQSDLQKQVDWKNILLISLFKTEPDGDKRTIGVIGVNGLKKTIEEEQQKALNRLASRAAMALNDRRQQEELLSSMEMFAPQVSVIQTLLAAGRYDRRDALSEELPLDKNEVNQWVKDALSHLWGGPKLSHSPLLQMLAVQKMITENGDSSDINALKGLLRDTIQLLRPAGERQFTNEWILYNLLDLRFIEGMKVKDIARRLSLSEADLYRKQRIAVAAVADHLINIEMEARRS